MEKCDAILVFCFIISRTGTDIDAALNELNALSGVVLLVHVLCNIFIQLSQVIVLMFTMTYNNYLITPF